MTSGVSGSIGQSVAGYLAPTDVKPGAAVEKAAGSGSLGSPGGLPAAQRQSTMSAMNASLFAMTPKVTGAQLDVLLLEVTTKMKDTISATEKNKIETDTNAKKLKIDEKKAKLEEAQKKIDQAENKMKNLSIWDKIKIGFQFLGAIVSFAAGALMAATGVGVLAGAALMAAGVLMFGLAVDAVVAATSKDGLGIMGQIVKADLKARHPDWSEEKIMGKATEAEMISRIVVSSVAAILSLAGGIGAIKGAATAIQSALSITGAVASIMTGVGDGVVGGLKYDATKTKAEGMKTQSEGKAMAALIQSLDDAIDQAMARLKGAAERFDGMLDAITEAMQDRGQTLARVGLRA